MEVMKAKGNEFHKVESWEMASEMWLQAPMRTVDLIKKINAGTSRPAKPDFPDCLIELRFYLQANRPKNYIDVVRDTSMYRDMQSQVKKNLVARN